MRKASLVLVASLTTGLSVASAFEPPAESLAQIKAAIDAKSGVLVDVREKKEWDAGHVKEAVFMPLGTIEDGLSKDESAKLPKDKIIYLHCAIGLRAQAAGEVLEKLGYTVRPLDANYKDLVSAGFRKE